MTCQVPPPDDAAWWDSAITRDALLHRLRLTSGDIDDNRVAATIPVVGARINAWLDCVDAPPGPPPHPTLQEALVVACCELYNHSTPSPSPTDPAAAWSWTTFDPLAGVYWMLAPFKQRRGVA